jgi:hypothetical protein
MNDQHIEAGSLWVAGPPGHFVELMDEQCAEVNLLFDFLSIGMFRPCRYSG